MAHHHHSHEHVRRRVNMEDHLNQILEARQVFEPEKQVSIVYVTQTPTFSGPIGGYITLGANPPSAPTPSNPPPAPTTQAPSSQQQPTTQAPSPSSTSESTSATSQASSDSASSSSLSSSISSSLQLSSDASATPSTTFLAVASSSAPAAVTASVGHAQSSASAAPTPAPSSGGMSGGAKAGIAIAVLLIVGAVAGIGYFLYRKKQKEEQHQPIDDEKFGHSQTTAAGFAGVANAPRSNSTAPRLSLRPVAGLVSTSAQPNEVYNEKDATPVRDPFHTPQSSVSAWERRGAATDPTNPFGNHAETLEAATFGKSGKPAEIAAAPLGLSATRESAVVPKPLSIRSARSDTSDGPPTPSSTGSVNAGQVATATAATAATAAAVPTALAAPKGPPSNVHRVQMDFKPSMDDELELISGQLVRLLHEYDDGWALCIRMDRSQQGVAPRTCLSKLPLKPRPARPNGKEATNNSNNNLAAPASPSLSQTSGYTNDSTMVPRPLTPNSTKPANMSPFPTTENVHGNVPRPRTKSVSGGSRPESVGTRRRSRSVAEVSKADMPAPPAPLNVSRPGTPTRATAGIPARKPIASRDSA